MRIEFENVEIDLIEAAENNSFQRTMTISGSANWDGGIECREVTAVTRVMDSYQISGKPRSWNLQSPADDAEDIERLLWINEHIEDREDWQRAIDAVVMQKVAEVLSTPKRALAFAG